LIGWNFHQIRFLTDQSEIEVGILGCSEMSFRDLTHKYEKLRASLKVETNSVQEDKDLEMGEKSSEISQTLADVESTIVEIRNRSIR
jgi:hypothetical protein